MLGFFSPRGYTVLDTHFLSMSATRHKGQASALGRVTPTDPCIGAWPVVGPRASPQMAPACQAPVVWGQSHCDQPLGQVTQASLPPSASQGTVAEAVAHCSAALT